MFGNSSNTITTTKNFTGSACPNTNSPLNGTVGKGVPQENVSSPAKCRHSTVNDASNTGSAS
jgi:hypothetical protein